jgi:hypothetical protein
MRDSSRTPVVSAAVGALVLAGVVAFSVGLEDRDDSDAAPVVPTSGVVGQDQ